MNAASTMLNDEQTRASEPPVWKLILAEPSLLLYMAAVALSLTLGFFTYYHLLPGSVRWSGELLVLAMAGLAVAQMLLGDYVPQALILIIAVTVVGSTVAVFEGQAPAATVWGWWTLFKYPMVGLFVYLNRSWPPRLAGWFYRFCFAVLGIQVVVQIGQFLAGEVPGDNLTGTFGRHSTKPLTLFILLTVAFAFGRWLVYADWKTLVFTLMAGGLSSVLGAMRLYPIGVGLLSVWALIAYVFSGKRFDRSFFYLFLVVAVLAAFPLAYDRIVAETRGLTSYTENILNVEQQQQYFDKIVYDPDTGTYTFGRSYSVEHGWTSLQRDATTLLFGYGLGARALSTSLGIVGERLRQEPYGVMDSYDSLTMMQELGLAGLAALAFFLLWVIVRLWRCARDASLPDLQVLAYGLIFFSLGWPVWLWYSRTWQYAVPMLLYWGLMGYTLQTFNRERAGEFRAAEEETGR